MDIHTILDKVAELIPLEDDPQWHPLRRAIARHCAELEAVQARLAGLDRDTVASITRAVRLADRKFQTTGGSSRHWVREFFIPELEKEGLVLTIKARRECGLEKE